MNMEWSEKLDEIFPAYIEAWGKIQAPSHSKEVLVETKKGDYTYSYTDLNGIYDAIKQLLSENGMAIMHDSYTDIDLKDGIEKNYMNTILVHTSGQYVKSGYLAYPVQTLSRKDYNTNEVKILPDMQGNGGQLTYMRRYSLSATMGISTEKDMDGNDLEKITPEPKNKKDNAPAPTQAPQNQPQGAAAGKTGNNSQNNQNRSQGTSGGNNNNAPKLASPKQVELIKTKLKKLGSMYDMTAGKMLELLDAGHKTKTDVPKLTSAQASAFITLLADYEGGKALPEIYPDGKSVTGNETVANH